MRFRTRRLVATLFAPWFAAVTVQPAAFHQCAMHSSGSAAMTLAVTAAVPQGTRSSAPMTHEMTGQSAAAPMSHAMHQMAGHTMAAPVADAESALGHGRAPAKSHTDTCSCDDGCCVTSVAATPPTFTELSFAPEFVRRAAPRFAATAVFASATPHALPFATAPPARV